jgi:hypothetical protein
MVVMLHLQSQENRDELLLVTFQYNPVLKFLTQCSMTAKEAGST